MPKGKILMGKKTPKPVVPPKPKGKNPPSVVYKNMTPDIRYSGPATVPSLEEMRKRKQDGAKMQKAAPAPKRVTRRGGK